MPVTVSGLAETRKALRQLAPDIYKNMNKEIGAAMRVVVTDARGMVQPSVNGLYNWQDKGTLVKSRSSRERAFPKYNSQVIKKGLTYSLGQSKKNKAGFVSLYRLLNKSAAGSIIETAGRLNFNGDRDSQSNNPNAGAHFNRAIQSTYGGFATVGKGKYNNGRLMAKAIVKNEGKAQAAIFAALDKASKEFKARTSNVKASKAA